MDINMVQPGKIDVPLVKSIRSISLFSNNLASIFLFLLVMLVSVHVIGRYFFTLPVPGAVELIQYLMVCVGSLGFAYCASQQEHVRVDLFVERLPRRGKQAANFISLLLSFGIVALMTWQGIVHAIDIWHSGSVSGVLKIPRFPFSVILAFSYVLFMLELSIQLLRLNNIELTGEEE